MGRRDLQEVVSAPMVNHPKVKLTKAEQKTSIDSLGASVDFNKDSMGRGCCKAAGGFPPGAYSHVALVPTERELPGITTLVPQPPPQTAVRHLTLRA